MAPPPLDTVILGAGAAGMMCAIHAAARGARVLVIDHARAPGEKIRISGGGRCNFTNLHTAPDRFISGNRHFAKSALGRYRPQDFIALVEKHRIAWHEKTLGQLFCDGSAKQIVAMLLAEMAAAGAELRLGVGVETVERGDLWRLRLTDGAALTCRRLVVATGGKSIPKMGATGLGYRIAEQFGLGVTETRPGLVPLTFTGPALDAFQSLAGVAVPVRAACGKATFDEAMLFTHRGLSGPAILQISSYWREGQGVAVDLAPGLDALALLKARRAAGGGAGLAAALAEFLPRRLAAHLAAEGDAEPGARDAATPDARPADPSPAPRAPAPLATLSDARLSAAAAAVHDWSLRPTGSEGYRTAEVTVGGVDTRGLDSATMEARAVPGLFFVGEVVDVTGWLGGYNFQWAWASGWAAGSAIADKSI